MNRTDNSHRKTALMLGGGLVALALGVAGWTYGFTSNHSAYLSPSGQTSLQPPGGLHPVSKDVNADPDGDGRWGETAEISVSATHGFAGSPIVVSISAGQTGTLTGQPLPAFPMQIHFSRGSSVRALTPLVSTPFTDTPLVHGDLIIQQVTELLPSSNARNQNLEITGMNESATWSVIPPRGASDISVAIHLSNGWHRFQIPLTMESFPLPIHTKLVALTSSIRHDDATFGMEGGYGPIGSLKGPALPPGTVTFSFTGTATGLKPQTETVSTTNYSLHNVTFALPVTPSSRGTVIQTSTASSLSLAQLLSGFSSGSQWTTALSGYTGANITPRYTVDRFSLNISKMLLRDWYWLLIALIGLGALGTAGIDALARRKTEQMSSTSGYDYRDPVRAPEDRDR